MVHEKENELALQWADMRMIGKKTILCRIKAAVRNRKHVKSGTNKWTAMIWICCKKKE